jgi:hypothetical protein
VSFLWAKGLNAKDILKETFAVYGRKYLSLKAVHSWFEKLSQGRLKVADDASPGVEVAEITVKRLLCCWFQCTGKAMDKMGLRCNLLNDVAGANS